MGVSGCDESIGILVSGGGGDAVGKTTIKAPNTTYSY